MACPRPKLFQILKRPGGEVSHLRPSSAKVNNEQSYTSASLIYLHGVDRKSFTLLGNMTIV
jgi:hypothetical protein